MPAIFSRTSDALFRQAAVGVAVALGLAAVGWYYYALPSYTRVGYQPDQPVPFSHQQHVGQLGLDCTYCHTQVFESPHANVPTSQTCMNCHDPRKANVKGTSPLLAPVRQGFDTGRPAAWAAEGLLGFLPPEAQDRLLDKITELSADGSQVVAEVFINSGSSGDALKEATRKWQDAGLDVALDDLGFPGDRNDAATYLADRGWQPVRTPLNQLMADNGLPLQPGDEEAPFGKNYYCTAVLRTAD